MNIYKYVYIYIYVYTYDICILLPAAEDCFHQHTVAPCRRKLHYGHMLGHLHLKGIGGAGAPHIFRMERLKDTGPN